MLVKGVLLWPLGRLVGGLDRRDALRLAVLLASGGEFAFVVLKQAQGQGLVGSRQDGALVLAITLSMALTPLLVALLAKLLGSNKAKKPARDYDTIEAGTPRVIIAGFGRMGQVVGRILRGEGIPFVALDHSIEQMDMVRRFGNWTDIFYGDPARPELLRAAQADKAEVFVLASDDPESSLRVARVVKRMYPHLKIVARARNRQHVWRLMDMGIDEPVRETLYSSLKMTKQALVALGMTPEHATDRVERFRRQDAELIRTQHLVYDDEAKLVQTTREALAELEKLFEADTSPEAEEVRERDAGTPLTDES
jgi:glutathione-regulated potassium-efflux system protein KefB